MCCVCEQADLPQNRSRMNSRFYAALSGALAVTLGAFGAHGLKDRVSAEHLEVWKTASQYHFVHTLAVLLNSEVNKKPMLLSNKLFFAGTLVFSGSLYALVLSQEKKLGAVTPIGGLLLIGGWLAMAVECSSA